MHIVIDMISIFLLACIPASFSYFLDYCLGHPMSDNNSLKAIFSGYTLWMAKRAIPTTVEQELVANYAPFLNNDNPEVRAKGKSMLNNSIVHAAKDYYYWEKAFGMCIFCTNFWIALISALIMHFTISLSYLDDFSLIILVPIFSHSILRKL